MELWIRSQDRKRLIKPNRLHVKVDPRSREGYIFESANSLRYGTYESEERALEVLDEIEEHLDYLNIGNIDRVDDKGFRVSTIYQMPEV